MQNKFSQMICIAAAMLLPAMVTQAATGFSILHSFGVLTNVTGFNPASQMVQGPDGTLYGTTKFGEGYVEGVVFRISSTGTNFSVLKYFTDTNLPDGEVPKGQLVLANGRLYGVTAADGSNNIGTIFAVSTNGTGFMTLHTFSATNGPGMTNSDGAHPLAGLALSGSMLYGTAALGGTNGQGTVFALNTNGTGFVTLHSFSALPANSPFTNSDGANPQVNLAVSNGTVFGVTENGGFYGTGTFFSVGTNGAGFTNFFNINGNTNHGTEPTALLLSGNTLYGTAYLGGSNNMGCVFSVNTNGTGYTLVHSFDSNDGSYPQGLLLSGNTFYGTTEQGGTNLLKAGTVFKMNADGSGFTNLFYFISFNNVANAFTNVGYTPQAGLILSNNILFGSTFNGGSGLKGTIFSMNTNGASFSNLWNFAYSDAVFPEAGVIFSGGTLYGTTEGGGKGFGTVFALGTNGACVNLRSFTNTDGSALKAKLTFSGSRLYSAAGAGGVTNTGTIFALGTNGLGFTNLFSFLATTGVKSTNGTGAFPLAGLTPASGNLYGVASKGGTNGTGTIFSLATNGNVFTVIHNFATNTGTTSNPTNSDGALPECEFQLLGGMLYGMAPVGGSNGQGTLFAINANGTGFTNLHTYNGTDGSQPVMGFLLSGNLFYGATGIGGSNNSGTIFVMNTNGTAYTILHEFAPTNGSKSNLTNAGGANPSGLILSGNAFYGTTATGGSLGYGTIFSMNTDGSGFTTLYNFDYITGALPIGDLFMLGNTIYGATVEGGGVGDGEIYAYTVPPYLNISPLPGKVILSWNDPTFVLQSATNVAGTYSNILGAASPFTNAVTGASKFFRLQGN